MAALVAVGLVGAGCTSGTPHGATSHPASSGTRATPSPSASGEAAGVQPLTDPGTEGAGAYYSDPYPIHRASSYHGARSQYFSGTTKSLLHCPGGTPAHCKAGQKVEVSAGPALVNAAKRYGSRTTVVDNENIYQLDSGEWEMAATMYVKNPAYPHAAPWTVVVHAHARRGSPSAVPANWTADSLVAGSFERPEKADYDGKYFEDGGKLYLIYSKRLSGPSPEDGIVAQEMESSSHPAASGPVLLLGPEDSHGGYNSEYFFGLDQTKKFKLIETGNITRIGGKYVMAYSTGAFNERDYKSGLAWSDTLIPAHGSSYRRILRKDSSGVWGKPGGSEVDYLLQTQEKAWPNYVADRVLAPGVPSVVEADGKWALYFAGYLPTDAPRVPGGKFDASHRRPYVMRLKVDVPRNADVRQASDAELAGWVTRDS
ncbi:hypothetical protein [Streptomyces sp. NBC_00859]|uniref:hypothetical protein n=1 Tax=Streptomyces sp. NBC_00859 TaxID=2903682 RepID=UPI00387073E2|nr:hypothetical protein OG584_32475 [Streptomyces sp. NBC_00859]